MSCVNVSIRIHFSYVINIHHRSLDEWFTKLTDKQAKRRIQVRIDRVDDGNFGDTEQVGEGVSELRFFFGPGYRIYYCKQGQRVVILLAGGDKSTQSKDIKLALQLAQDLEEEL